MALSASPLEDRNKAPFSSSTSSSSQSLERPQQANVRSALVTLGQSVGKSYWGTMKNEQPKLLSSMQVKTTKIQCITSSATVNSNAAGASGGRASSQNKAKNGSSIVPVKPMAKASSARTSRILEGSMDTSN